LEIDMPTSSAISAQGAVLSIGTGTGGAKTISAVAVGFPTIFTSAAHGFQNGDFVTFASLTGANAALFNGLSFTVTNKTTNTFAIDVDTTGLVVTAGTGTATPVTFTQINNVKSYTGFDGSASELDRTNLSSTAKEFVLGLVDPGQFSIEVDIDLNDVGQAALRAKQQSGVISNFKLVLPGVVANLTYTFTGFVKKFSQTGGVDQVVKGSVDIRITGTVTLA
jgi:hypothetical protein